MGPYCTCAQTKAHTHSISWGKKMGLDCCCCGFPGSSGRTEKQHVCLASAKTSRIQYTSDTLNVLYKLSRQVKLLPSIIHAHSCCQHTHTHGVRMACFQKSLFPPYITSIQHACTVKITLQISFPLQNLDVYVKNLLYFFKIIFHVIFLIVFLHNKTAAGRFTFFTGHFTVYSLNLVNKCKSSVKFRKFTKQNWANM